MSETQFVSRRTTGFLNLPKYLQTQFLISFLLSSIITLTLLVVFFSLQPVVPLFYSLAEPAEYLVAKEWLIIFPVLSFAVSVGHVVVIRQLFHYERIIPQLFSWVTVVVEVLLTLSFFRIIFLVT